MPCYISKSIVHKSVLVVSNITRQSAALQQQWSMRAAHTVRLIVRQDIPPKAYEGDILQVKAGYARNYLIPEKKAVYATRQNFEKLGMQDPELETTTQRRDRLAREAVSGEDVELKAADVLKHYLRNKVLKLWRNADNTTSTLTLGAVDATYIRKKLSKQLRIDLEPHETIHLRADPVHHAELDQNPSELEAILNSLSSEQPCSAQAKQLGEYIACISLRGGYRIPLRIEVIKR